jgi:predicted nucleic acid-binding protein
LILLLDSTVLIDLLRAHEDRKVQVKELVMTGNGLSTSAINIAEVYAGMRPSEETRTSALLSSLDCYPVTDGIARRAGLLRAEWSRRGRTLSLADMVIAATALEHGLVLMTENRKDFPIPALKFHPTA